MRSLRAIYHQSATQRGGASPAVGLVFGVIPDITFR